MRWLRNLFVVVAILSGGCRGPFPGITTVDPNRLRFDQAVVVVSTTSEDACPFQAVELAIHRNDETSPLSIAVMQGQNPSGPTDFPGIHGRVYTMVLEPGDYYFRLHSLSPQVRFVNGSAHAMYTKPVKIEGGMVTYAGEFRDIGCNPMRMVIQDSSTRDLKRLKVYKPNLDLNRVQVELAEMLDN